MSAADRVAVPRSSTRDRRKTAPGASIGSHTDPARIARLMVTAGKVGVSFAMTTTPLGRTVRVGARPERTWPEMASELGARHSAR